MASSRKTAVAITEVAVIVLAVLFLFWSFFPFILGFESNIGLPFGYYGRLNRVISRIKDIPNTRVVRTWVHKDTSIEDFGFLVQTQSGLQFRLQFAEAHTRRTYELFDQADDLLVFAESGQRYSLGAENRLEEEIGQPIRNASDVIRHFDRIAEIIVSDREKGTTPIGWPGHPENSVVIYYPIPKGGK